jgi:peptidoglycan/xylan/chitin deacetylase (PgdA/CDA1 family)
MISTYKGWKRTIYKIAACAATGVLLSFGSPAPTGLRMAITLDDLPALSHGIIPETEQAAFVRRILQTLKKYEIRAVGFVVGGSIRPANRGFIDEFLRAGHEIGNHTDTHPDLNRTSAGNFLRDIDSCGEKLSGFGVPVRYFRFPMLHQGETREKRDAVAAGIRARNLIVAPVTIDSDEADFNLKYVRAHFEGRENEAEMIARDYVLHMLQKTREYSGLADRLFGRPVPHILLLHMNFINSVVLDELLGKCVTENWSFTTLDEAMSDPLYSMEDPYVGPKGLSLLERLAAGRISRGRSLNRFRKSRQGD